MWREARGRASPLRGAGASRSVVRALRPRPTTHDPRRRRRARARARARACPPRRDFDHLENWRAKNSRRDREHDRTWGWRFDPSYPLRSGRRFLPFLRASHAWAGLVATIGGSSRLCSGGDEPGSRGGICRRSLAPGRRSSTDSTDGRRRGGGIGYLKRFASAPTTSVSGTASTAPRTAPISTLPGGKWGRKCTPSGDLAAEPHRRSISS
jgi:hypothetical protein